MFVAGKNGVQIGDFLLNRFDLGFKLLYLFAVECGISLQILSLVFCEETAQFFFALFQMRRDRLPLQFQSRIFFFLRIQISDLL